MVCSSVVFYEIVMPHNLPTNATTSSACNPIARDKDFTLQNMSDVCKVCVKTPVKRNFDFDTHTTPTFRQAKLPFAQCDAAASRAPVT